MLHPPLPGFTLTLLLLLCLLRRSNCIVWCAVPPTMNCHTPGDRHVATPVHSTELLLLLLLCRKLLLVLLLLLILLLVLLLLVLLLLSLL